MNDGGGYTEQTIVQKPEQQSWPFWISSSENIFFFFFSDEIVAYGHEYLFKVTNWYSTCGPGVKEYFEPKNTEIQQYLGGRIFFSFF